MWNLALFIDLNCLFSNVTKELTLTTVLEQFEVAMVRGQLKMTSASIFSTLPLLE